MSDWAPFPAGEIEGGTGKNGIMNVNAPYWVRTLAEALTWTPDDLVTTFFGLPIVERHFKQEWGNGKLLEVGKDGAYLLTFTLEGVLDSLDFSTPQGVEFDTDGTLGEENIATNPNIAVLKAKYEGSPDDSGRGIVFEPNLSDPESGEEIPNPLFGYENYSTPSLLWTRSYVTTNPPTDITTMLGRIDNPPPGPGGYLPQLDGRRNWLKTVGKMQFRGNIWQIIESWQMSPRGGFNEDVYR